MTISSVRVDGRRRTRFCQSRWGFGVFVLLLATFQFAGRVAQAADVLDRPITLDIPANTPLDEALIQWGVKARVALMINTQTIEDRKSHGVRGTMPAGNALFVILRDSGLTYTFNGERIRVLPATALVRSSQREGQPGLPATSWSGDSQVMLLNENSTGNRNDANRQTTPTNIRTTHLEEVVVTAQKRTERLQDVPSAVSALTGNELQAMGAESFTDYARSIPGLTFTDSGDGQQKPSIRGVNASTGSNTVSYYIGETPLPSASPNTSSLVNPYLIDIERIEVLRGPQGTLYGSGSMGGTIRLIPNPPDLSKLEGSVQGTAMLTQGADGPSPGGGGDLVLNVPIVEGVAGVRGVFWARDVGGFINRTYGSTGNLGSTPGAQGMVGNIPDEHTWGFRGTALFQPVEQFNVSALIYFQNQHFNGFQDITAGATNPGNRLVQDLISNVPEPQNFRFTLYSLTANYNFGSVNLTSSTGYSTQVVENHEEGTSLIQAFLGGPPFPTAIDQHQANYNLTEEARLATSERLYGFDVVLGVFYSRSHGSLWFNWPTPQYNSLVAGNDPANPVYAPDNNLFGAGVRTAQRQTAEFGEITYHLTDALSATAGLRHFETASSTDSWQAGLLGTGSDIPSYTSTSGPSNGTIYKGNISYKVTPNHLVYAQYSEGFRPGGGNTPPPASCDAPPSASTVQPDSLKNYELGAKTMWLDKRLTVDAALYRIDWRGIQQTVLLPCGFGYTGNFGDALIKGAELEVTDQITDRLSAGASGGYIRAQLQQSDPTLGALAGDPIENVPNWQFSMHIETTFPILETDDGFARVDYQYTGHSWGNYTRLSDGARDPFAEVQVTRLLGFKAGMRHHSWEFSVSGTNLLNQIATQSIDPWASLTVAIPGRPRLVVNRPRTFLINAIYKF